MKTHLCYHEIGAGESPYLYSLPARTFLEHVAVASARGACVTFDDGHKSQFENGLPALDRHQAKAIFFCTAGWIERDPDAMSWEQLRELARLGHRIAAHGWSHKFLTLCSQEELATELLRARRHLEDGLGLPVDALSLPNGRWNRRVLEACAEHGYRQVFGSYPWFPREAAGHASGIELVGRMNVPKGMEARRLEAILLKGPEKQRLARLKTRAINATRAVIGDENYQRLWCWLARRDPKAEARRGRTVGDD
jgi:peptidoglycan/xylan/chitin deacetylase (PgdA/CDA1 family)